MTSFTATHATLPHLESIPIPFGHFWENYLPPAGMIGKRKQIFCLETKLRADKDWISKIYEAEFLQDFHDENSRFGLVVRKYVIQKCQWIAFHGATRIGDGFGTLSPVYGVYQGDGIIGELLHEKLCQNVAMLESDWMTTNNIKNVLDQVHLLVDPALHCLVYGVTPILDFSTITNTSTATCKLDGFWSKELSEKHLHIDTTTFPFNSLRPKAVASFNDPEISNKFQFIPTNLHVDAQTRKISIESYINNLNPIKYKDLYTQLESIFELGLPLLENVLTDLLHIEGRILDDLQYPNLDGTGSEVADEEDERDWSSYDPIRPKKIVDLSGLNLQVIVSLKSIQLTPANPRLNGGGQFHVEGLKNERIVACLIYYYDVVNIKNAALEFRVESRNFARATKFNTNLGYTNLSSDQLIAYPNIYQTSESPFELIDEHQPGHCKSLIFWLVDPTIEIMSTKQVPPQQASWYNYNPVEVKHPSWIMTLDAAIKYQERINQERSKQIQLKK